RQLMCAALTPRARRRGTSLHRPTAQSPKETVMHATSDSDEKANVRDAFPRLELTASSGQPVTIPDPAGDFVHLQFRRFAGCPICNLHFAAEWACVSPTGARAAR